jgi:hypothetical protein
VSNRNFLMGDVDRRGTRGQRGRHVPAGGRGATDTLEAHELLVNAGGTAGAAKRAEVDLTRPESHA